MSWYLITRRKTAPREAPDGADPASASTHSADAHEDAPARPPYRNAAAVLAIAIGIGAIFAT